MSTTKIEWTDTTWNPVTGCDRVSPGCDHCYAERMASRLAGRFGYPADEPFRVTLHPERLTDPLHWRKPRRVFVNSMSDLFHPDVPDDFIDAVWGAMIVAHEHQFQVLTKRPQRMAACRRAKAAQSNVWLGTSIENDHYAFRANHLRDTPAAVRFLSLEPLLGPLPSLNLTGIDWVILGGESGPGARPMHPDWARDLRDRCVAAGVPFFFKQWGEWAPRQADEKMMRVGKKWAGRLLDGRTWDEMPAGR